jgi:leader peptidase (prepilin peptidase)/N-methyltransferase
MGLIIGSFLNVCIVRIPEGKSIVFPPSSCPNCNKKLKALELIPLFSYIFLGGKCKGCKERISIRYPIVELMTALFFALMGIKYGFSIETLLGCALMSVLIVVFFIDLKTMIIPNQLVIAGLVIGVLGFIYQLFTPVLFYFPAPWYAPLIGMVSASGLLFIVALIGLLIYKNDGAMGMGDVKIYLPIGLIIGYKLALISLFIAIILGGVIGILLMIFKIKKRKDAIQFGPFIIIATGITMLYGNELFSSYLRLLTN